MSDPGTSYRTRDEVQEVRQTRDPITSFKEKIIDTKLVTAEELKAIETEIRISVDEATKAAKADREIGLEELTTDVYSRPIEPFIRGTTIDRQIKHATLKKAVNL